MFPFDDIIMITDGELYGMQEDTNTLAGYKEPVDHQPAEELLQDHNSMTLYDEQSVHRQDPVCEA